MAENSTLSQELTYKQRKAISALLATRTELQAAEMAGVSPRTMARWLTMPHFRAELRKASIDASQKLVGATMRRLTTGQETALAVLWDVMARGNNNERRLAATSWLMIYRDLAELIDFEDRISQLEKDLGHDTKN
jgi:hypothetical protein